MEDTKKALQFFSALADETRLTILLSLADSPKSVNQIYDSVGREKITLSAISHQLKGLSDQDIINFTKKGREKQFRLSEKFCWCILHDALKHFDSKTKCKACCHAQKYDKKWSK